MKTVAIIGTFDSKGAEYAFIKDVIEAQGLKTLTVHVGTFAPLFTPDVSNKEIASAASGDVDKLMADNDRGAATDTMSRGLAVKLPELYSAGKFDGVIALGGSGGTSIATPAMQKLPVGVPKIMVSTVAAANPAQYVGTSDIIMIPSIVDVAGLNSISTKIFSNAALAICGMVKLEANIKIDQKPLIAATMFGVTTPAVNQARTWLEEAGYEVLVFHATGTGGKTMESLVDAGYIEGVLDLTTTEWCDELVGGVFNAGPDRLEMAGSKGIPQVVSVGALDMVNFGAYDTVPPQFAGRNLYKHNPSVTLMRTTVEENRKLGEIIASKLNMAKGPTAMFIPLKGVSMIDAEGQPFYGKDEDEALFDALRQNLDKNVVELIELDMHINDPAFSEAIAKHLLKLMK